MRASRRRAKHRHPGQAVPPLRSVRFQSANPRDLTLKTGDLSRPRAPTKALICRKIRPIGVASGSACQQKVVGFGSHQPLSEDLRLQVFSLRQSPCASASGRTDSGLAVRRSSAALCKTPSLQANSRSAEPKSFCRPTEGRVSRLLRPLAGCSCKRHVHAHGRLPARYQRSRSSGTSPLSVRYREADPGPHSDPGEPWLPRELSAGRRPRQRRGAGAADDYQPSPAERSHGRLSAEPCGGR